MPETAPQTHYAGSRVMPFRKMSGGKYKGPSGRTFTQKQVNLYYANNGFNAKKRRMRKKKA